MTIAQRIQKYRRARGLSQRALAPRAGLSLGYLGRLEAGYHPAPSVVTLTKLARALGVRVAKLVED